ncbi:hypothetical protein D3C78_1403980 [compost metagenome]
MGYLAQYGLGALLGGAGRQLDHVHEYPLILVGQEGGRQADEQQRHTNHNQQVDQQHTTGMVEDIADAALIMLGAAVEQAVKPGEEAGFGRMHAGFQQRDAQCRSQDHRHQYRQHHGGNDGD